MVEQQQTHPLPSRLTSIAHILCNLSRVGRRTTNSDASHRKTSLSRGFYWEPLLLWDSGHLPFNVSTQPPPPPLPLATSDSSECLFQTCFNLDQMTVENIYLFIKMPFCLFTQDDELYGIGKIASSQDRTKLNHSSLTRLINLIKLKTNTLIIQIYDKKVVDFQFYFTFMAGRNTTWGHFTKSLLMIFHLKYITSCY